MEEGRLRLVRELVNTCDLERLVEALPNTGDLAAWLRHLELIDGATEVGDADLVRVIELREAVRQLLIVNHDGVTSTAAEQAAAYLSEVAHRVQLRPVFSADGFRLAAASTGVDHAIGAFLAVIVQAMADGNWSRLKACSSDICRWAFYDTTRSGGGRWCSMRVCGNKRKAAAFRARKRAAAAAGS
ncbi:hypothetical protein Cme02nite_03710 [Catellatospora methionotrophica]|uniref:Zinc finger CGNR domain-containing protein n=1 Tax=Catellatospora methionotrophica TaxID=121620 RepID=A0A8J3LAD3_9ACTN|nr:CGNR zinc finger domain-containing protein [Catellatospora methionotrophica]GIG12039.1 hypothetical protein Cme02nite_03710 [Catellatospora methionotrophica]